jgi:hypothetical protein
MCASMLQAVHITTAFSTLHAMSDIVCNPLVDEQEIVSYVAN